MMKLGKFQRAAMLLAGSFAAFAAVGQAAPRTRPAPQAPRPAAAAPAATPAAAPAGDAPGPSTTGLNLPSNPAFLGDTDTSVRKATAIVNGTVITGTDVDQRLALIVLANGGQIPAQEVERPRPQVLPDLVGEALHIPAAPGQA